MHGKGRNGRHFAASHSSELLWLQGTTVIKCGWDAGSSTLSARGKVRHEYFFRMPISTMYGIRVFRDRAAGGSTLFLLQFNKQDSRPEQLFFHGLINLNLPIAQLKLSTRGHALRILDFAFGHYLAFLGHHIDMFRAASDAFLCQCIDMLEVSNNALEATCMHQTFGTSLNKVHKLPSLTSSVPSV